jgi:hypothetical protein
MSEEIRLTYTNGKTEPFFGSYFQIRGYDKKVYDLMDDKYNFSFRVGKVANLKKVRVFRYEHTKKLIGVKRVYPIQSLPTRRER